MKLCNTAGSKSKKLHVPTARKKIKTLKRRVDFYDEMIQKLIELLDGIKINPTQGVVLTPKKKRLYTELRNMGQPYSKKRKKPYR